MGFNAKIEREMMVTAAIISQGFLLLLGVMLLGCRTGTEAVRVEFVPTPNYSRLAWMVQELIGQFDGNLRVAGVRNLSMAERGRLLVHDEDEARELCWKSLWKSTALKDNHDLKTTFVRITNFKRLQAQFAVHAILLDNRLGDPQFFPGYYSEYFEEHLEWCSLLGNEMKNLRPSQWERLMLAISVATAAEKHKEKELSFWSTLLGKYVNEGSVDEMSNDPKNRNLVITILLMNPWRDPVDTFLRLQDILPEDFVYKMWSSIHPSSAANLEMYVAGHGFRFYCVFMKAALGQRGLPDMAIPDMQERWLKALNIGLESTDCSP